MLGAAASAIILSLVGAAAIGGLLPNARSDKTDTAAPRSAPVSNSVHLSAPRLAAGDSTCVTCGTVDSIHAVELKGNATGLGAVAGGVTGALAGNTFQKYVNKRYSYRVKVRMDDGTFRAVSQVGAPAVEIGERVRVIDGTVIALS